MIFAAFFRLLNACADWHLGVGGKGAVIAILQDTSLEIRVKKDEYLSVVGKNLNCESIVIIII